MAAQTIGVAIAGERHLALAGRRNPGEKGFGAPDVHRRAVLLIVDAIAGNDILDVEIGLQHGDRDGGRRGVLEVLADFIVLLQIGRQTARQHQRVRAAADPFPDGLLRIEHLGQNVTGRIGPFIGTGQRRLEAIERRFVRQIA